MSILDRFKRWRLSHQLNENDAPSDTDTAMTRAQSGDGTGGAAATTGTASNGEFVGRVSGDETDGQTGAAARAGVNDDPDSRS
ncbi:hypothetical protein [Kribbella sp. CA-293567]|uniref:hypothetical protein n=1 Tax=Kribbella sp. CA-293567 TaxID=3002436 RepID=UPI0022DD9892|nr:hypothetical protein [Kribbella sp. CA-293567]WBQ07943.1 hypothetical protein OX958_14335 [Kribbella sp. CA-293567]